MKKLLGHLFEASLGGLLYGVVICLAKIAYVNLSLNDYIVTLVAVTIFTMGISRRWYKFLNEAERD